MHELSDDEMFLKSFWTRNGGRKKGISGVEESLLEVRRKQLIGTCFVRDLQQHEKVSDG